MKNCINNPKENTKLGYHQLAPNYGYYLDKIPKNVFHELSSGVSKLLTNFDKGTKMNDSLAGEIEHEYMFPFQNKTTSFIKSLVNKIESNSKYLQTNFNLPVSLKITPPWINFQKKHEYNPIHSHGGVYSFVIWYKIPYLLEEEKKQYGYKSNKDEIFHGQFHFITPKPHSTTSPFWNLDYYALEIDNKKEGYIAIFPSNLIHTVYPFYTSDEYRITISGNILIS